MLTHKRSAPAAAVHRRSAAVFLLADVLAAALLVFGNYFFLYVAPIQGLGGASMPLPQVQNNIQQSSQQQITEVTGSAPEQTRPVSLREKFAEHFTDTVVSSDTAYSSPNLYTAYAGTRTRYGDLLCGGCLYGGPQLLSDGICRRTV